MHSTYDINKYACGTFVPKNEKEKAKLSKWESETPVVQDPDGRFYYIEISVRHYPNLVTYEGVQYTRSGSTLQKLEGQDLERAILKTSGIKWDSFGTDIKIEELDPSALKTFREKSVAKGRLSEGAVGVSDKALIRNLNLLTPDGRLTRAGAMMFGDPEKVITGAYIKIAYFAPVGMRGLNTADDIIYHDDIHGPLVLQADRVLEILYGKYFKALVDYKGLQRVETYMIPIDVMREVLLNAIMHKNYASGNPIQIRVYDDHITVMNEGFWPFDVLPVEDAYKPEHESYQYNPLIAELFYKTGEVETWGRGFEKIAIACDQSDCPLPEIKATDRSVKLICNGCADYMRLLHHGQLGQIGADGVQRKKADKHQEAYIHMQDVLSRELSAKEKEKMLPLVEYFSENSTISASEAANQLGKSTATATRYLNKMISLDVLVRVGETNGATYILKGLEK